jgi:UDPglucose 6-dehydrogenase
VRHLAYAASPLAACDGADGVVVVTEWKEFRSPDFESMRARLKSPVIFDGRNLYDPEQVRAAGFRYYAIGRR